MNDSKHSVFLDTSFFKALLDAKDGFHRQADKIWLLLQEKNIVLTTTNYIIDETLTLVRIRCGLPVAVQLRNLLHDYSEYLEVIRVTIDDDASAWEWFEKDWSNLSFTDCVSFSVMKRLGLTNVASFDQHFSRAGFTLLSA